MKNNLELHKVEIKQYCINEYNKELKEAHVMEGTIDSMSYVKTPLYKSASHIISILSWNEYNGQEYKGKYQGRRLTCKHCIHCIDSNLCNDACNCNKLNDNIKIDRRNDICSNFDSNINVSYDINKYKSLEDYLIKTGKLDQITFTLWKAEKLEYCTFKDYIHYLNNEYYINWKGVSTLHLKHNILYIDNKYTLHVPINARWFNLDIIQDNNIYCSKITIPTKKRYTPYEVIGNNINFNILSEIRRI